MAADPVKPRRPSAFWPRALALSLLAAVAGLVWLESRSTLSTAIRERTPWLVWAAVKSGGSLDLHLLIYQPDRRSLDIVYFPPGPPAKGAKPLSSIEDPRERQRAASAWLLRQVPPLRNYKMGYLYLETAAMPRFEPPASLKVWIREHWSGLSAWGNLLALTRGNGRSRGAVVTFESDLPPFDLLVLALEASRLDPSRVRPAWLPEGPLRGHLITRLLAPPVPRPKQAPPIRTEVLNASGIKGVASNATKVLRSKGVDVVYYGNARPRTQSVVYDRLGRIENALAVAGSLGCPSAEAITRVEPRSLVEVTVLLAEDCVRRDVP